MIEAKSLTREFGALRAVDELSFSVEPGTVLGFLGPNGAGKSTTMKMLTGFLAPTSGTASIMGHDIIEDGLAARREMGYLPEGAPLYGELNVARFLHFAAEARGFRGEEVRRRVHSAVDRLNLGEVMGQSIETLSKGFKRRVGLAQAILHDPPVLILDEPTDGLDPNQKHQVRRLIREMSSDKIIIVSTHILEEVDALCSRAMIIARGKLLADDTPTGLLKRSRYHNAVTLVLDELEAAASRLGELPESREVEVRRGRLTVFPSGKGKLFEAVTEVVREAGWDVDQIQLEPGRLDEVFRTVTGQEAA
ncbi:ABC transporter ATP-binding protein [Wenzhouxiangella marina]|uniref:ABC transporter n=1 Tax=Wenzhouxiangella marina TaxID=1579979 RepID=A0A0K0XWR6_9GAMM|nr:ABC transporter ATP-binding protein [Wenzhouxiangella marina]AKS42123.1 ABC transporter [Wenzhouxiangella marina]MBB6086105.1 ABC-2 type transport system ATP-binding protein [Wenzhouxiangella marina]